MQPVPLALLTLGVGAIVGALIVVGFGYAFRLSARSRAMENEAIPDGARQMLAAMESGAGVVDASLTVLAVSSSGPRFGLVVGEPIDSELMRGLARQARADGLAHQERFRLPPSHPHRRDPGEGQLVVARAAPLGERLVLIVIDDVSEQERVEQMRRDFVANTSHELKTPVGAIALLGEAIDAAADDADQVRRFAARLQDETARLNELAVRITDLSRLQSAVEVLEPRPVQIDEVTASAVEANLVAAEASGIEIIRRGDPKAVVAGDPGMLTDAVSNLIANAIAYSPRGGRVGVGVRTLKDRVEIAVTDRGMGIPLAEQERIFERFYRADGARSRRTGGTGLGLSIVKHAVQQHGGSVHVWSRPKRGATFTVQLPRAEQPRNASGDGGRMVGEEPPTVQDREDTAR